MISWSTKRQLSIIGVLTIVVVFLIALPTFLIVYEAPTCFDGKKNQGEHGIDCGGNCAILCEAEALEPIVHWQRAFYVKDGVYNVVAYVENPNLDSGSNSVPYSFKLYDSENLLIQERIGKAFISPRKIFAVFEDGVLTGTREPVRTTFEFTDKPVWQKMKVTEPELRIQERNLSDEEFSPRLDAMLKNINLVSVNNIEVVAIIYNHLGNAIAASRTFVDDIDRETSLPVTFTWPKAFADEVKRTEVIYRVFPK